MREALRKLREKMKEAGVDLYLVTSDDFHMSEYVGDFFKCREFLTGFTGSAGTAVVTEKEALLFTDGRYFIQAEQELRGTGFSLRKIGVPTEPTLYRTVWELLPKGGTLGYDGRTVSAEMGKELREIAGERLGRVERTLDFIGEIWENRPAMALNPVWTLPEQYAGESADSKIRRVRAALRDAGAEALLLTAPEDIMWLLNLRGSDVDKTPVALSFLLLTEKEARFFRGETYGDIESAVTELPEGTRVFLDPGRVNDRLYRLVSEKYEVTEGTNPTSLLKAVKNETECENLRAAHVKDGVAMITALYEIENRVRKTAEAGRMGRKTAPFTECDAADIIDSARRAQEHFVDFSFDTIAGYGRNGAIVHYEPKRGTDAEIEPRSFLLTDSGGHYLEGTTDITRTWAMGPLTDEEKKCYTLVLKGHLDIAMAEFPEGTPGGDLDHLAREPLQKKGLDYRHGTGHGIGYLLSVHEGPPGFSKRMDPVKQKENELKPGMLISDEPGVYMEGKFGIRTENDLLVRREGEKLGFENLTLCPIDTRPVLPELLNEKEKAYLNAYHGKVYKTLAPLLPKEIGEWLREATKEI